MTTFHTAGRGALRRGVRRRTRASFFVFNGTGANVLSLRATCRPWEAAICATTAHLQRRRVRRARGDRRASSCWRSATENGKLTPELAEPMITQGRRRARRPAASDLDLAVHGARHASTRVDEMRALAELAHGQRDAVARRRRAAGQRRRGARPVAVGRSRPTRASTCCRSAAPRTACSARRRSCSSTATLAHGLPVPAQADAAARLEDALPRRPVRRAAGRRPVAAVRPARERDGGRAGRRRPRLRRTRRSRGPVQTNAVFATLAGGGDRGRCSVSSRSTSGTSARARSAGCARGTRPRTTWTPSRTRSAAHWADRPPRALPRSGSAE